MTLNQLVHRISNADLGRPALRCLRIFELAPDFFARLREECLDLYRSQYPSRVGDREHVTHWTRPRGTVLQFSLLNRTGRYDDTSGDHDQSCNGKYFHDADKYPVLADFLGVFEHSINCRLNVLGPKAALSAHKENVCFRTQSGTVGLRLRFHLPITTNEAAELILDGEVYRFQERQILFFNQGCVHGAKNAGGTDRLHLVWDMLLTPATARLMFGRGPAPLPALRYVPSDQALAPLRVEPIGHFVQVAPLDPTEVANAQLVDPQ